MITVPDTSSSAVLIALRHRTDLVIQEQVLHGNASWVVKDPLSLKYYRFTQEEHAIWSLLSGASTDVAILKTLKQRWPDCELDTTDIRSFAESLYHNGLVLADTPNQGQRLAARQQKNSRLQRKQKFLNLLAIRFRGINPTGLLKVLYPCLHWFFRPASICVVLALAVVAACAAMLHLKTLSTEILTMHENFGAGCWFMLACMLALTKMLHELGHALACKHCGGECHEIGVMLLVLTPCLYCDVSDSWLLPNKWHRAAIAAAGMYVEVALASIAMLIWWWSAPGYLHYVSLQVILICSVSTLLFNGNPLARYDGYYILADLVEVPNLRQRSRAALKSFISHFFLGIELPDNEEESPSRWMLFYAIASLIYRLQLLVAILWFLHGVFADRGLEVVWLVLAILTIGTAVVLPLWKAVCFLSRKEVQEQMNQRKVRLTGAVVAGLLGVVFFLPLPQHVVSTFETRLTDSVPIYATQDARLDHIYVKPGQKVQSGELLAELSNLDLKYEITRLSTETNSLTHRVSNLKFERFENEEAMEMLPQVAEILAAGQIQLLQRQQDQARLTVRSPIAGVVFTAQRRQQPVESSFLPAWSGTPLEPLNEGAVLTSGDVLCEIGDPKKWEAHLVIDQADIEYINVGQHVRLLLDAMPLESLRGEVIEIAQQEMEFSPESLSVQAGGQLPTRMDRHGKAHPSSTSYTVRVPFTALNSPLAIGLRGTARVHVGSATLASRLWNYLCRTFCFS